MQPPSVRSTHFGTAYSQGDLHALEIIEDRCAARRRHGLPQRYSKGRWLGKGGFAKCYEVQDMDTKELFAAKIVAKASVAKPRAMAKLRSEIAIHRSLNNKSVVKFYDYFEDHDFVYIILELCPNQTLNEFMRKRPCKRLSEPEAMFYLYDLIMALKYLHRRGVIHRDLKLGNIFLDAEFRLKVGDFGLAAQLEHESEMKRTICGTPNYIAPEILDGTGHSYAVDIWSLGVILYTMIVGRPPFETSDVKATYRKIRYNQYSFPEGVRVSDQAKDLVGRILRTDPRCRLSLDEILASSWFQVSRLPPAMPVTISAGTVSPRMPPAGGCSARSETPEGGAADFARIDSPAPHRVPLRDRSPHVVATPPGVGHLQPQAQVRGHGVAPQLPQGKQPLDPAAHGLTSGHRIARYNPSPAASCGRPPVVTNWSNDENAAPVSGNIAAAAPDLCRAPYAAAVPASPAKPQPSAQAGGVLSGCRSHEGLAPACGGRGWGGAAAIAQPVPPVQLAAAPSSGVYGVATTREPPRLVPGASVSVSARLIGYASARSSTCSPKHQAPPPAPQMPSLHSVRLPTSGLAGAPEGDRPAARAVGTAVRPDAQQELVMLASRGDRQQRPAAPPSPQLQQVQDDGRGRLSSRRGGERSCSTPALVGERSAREVVLGESVRGGGGGGAAASGTRCSARGESVRAGPDGRRQPSAPSSPVAMPDLWVAKWVDYSSKYGVGYILSDGGVGVYFNDSTKIILAAEGGTFDYITRRTQDKPEVRSTHTLDHFPEDLKKKVTLLRHFKNYMVADVLEKKDGATVGASSLPAPRQAVQGRHAQGQAPYVKKWTRNKYATVFQMSNKTIQVVFVDRTEAVVSSRAQVVTYVDKRGHVSAYPLSSVSDVPCPELAKRLQHTKDIMMSMLGARPSEVGQGAPAQ